MGFYDNKIFRPVTNTANGEVDSETRFHYHQQGRIVWAEYFGGSVARGSLIGTVRDDDDQTLDMRYHHVNLQGELMTGQCRSTPVRLPDGRLQLREKWQWTSGDCSSGESVIEEVEPAAGGQ
ncbi:uncharacterized protein PG998_012085 [Apiospora kogelbergensis]|uniref:N-acetylglutamate synthase n=1 Tax=Apiospora kogelbergensis TaxID=1337665 RepID=A0AAW0QNM6_9PEZI